MIATKINGFIIKRVWIDYRSIEKMPITIEVMNMISKLHEYKGRQELYI